MIIAIVLKISDEKISCDKANIGKGKMWLLPPPVMMMEGVEEQEEEEVADCPAMSFVFVC